MTLIPTIVSGVLLVFIIPEVTSHGRLVEPPSRSTMWRFGYDNPPNYSDSGLFCGGTSVQWNKNGGKCGVCGDSYSGPWPNEPGGKYANGVLVREYDMGQTIDVGVHLTANHKGWFEFRLCENNDPKARVEQNCFDRNLLADASGNTRFTVKLGQETLEYKLVLPAGVRCSACVFQWMYRTGNSWGTDPETGQGCIGCGAQETFQACADVSIDGENVVLGEQDAVDVEVPAKDVDERLWREAPSACAALGYVLPQTSGASFIVVPPFITQLMTIVLVFVSVTTTVNVF